MIDAQSPVAIRALPDLCLGMQMASPGPSTTQAGAWTIPLLGRSTLQLIENQFAMLLECAEALFERIEQ
jgi:hypothetical protein